MRFRTVTLMSVLAVAGCADLSPTGPAAPPEETALRMASVAAACASATNVRGTITVQLISPSNGIGTSTGGLAGTVAVALTGGTATGHASHLTMTHTFTTANGSTITTDDQAILAPISPPVFTVSVRYDIVGGTADYAGASGHIRTHGTVNLATGVIELRYVGRVCT